MPLERMSWVLRAFCIFPFMCILADEASRRLPFTTAIRKTVSGRGKRYSVMYERVIGSTLFVRGGIRFPLRLKDIPIGRECLSVVMGNKLCIGASSFNSHVEGLIHHEAGGMALAFCVMSMFTINRYTRIKKTKYKGMARIWLPFEIS